MKNQQIVSCGDWAGIRRAGRVESDRELCGDGSCPALDQVTRLCVALVAISLWVGVFGQALLEFFNEREDLAKRIADAGLWRCVPLTFV